MSGNVGLLRPACESTDGRLAATAARRLISIDRIVG
jgi:hypothetical protein